MDTSSTSNVGTGKFCDDQIEGTGCLAAPLNSGGMLIFDGLLHHGTPENHSPENRYALQFHYTGKSIKQITDEQRLEIYGPEGKNVTC